MYHLDCSVVVEHTLGKICLCCGDAVRSSVCLRGVLCILVTATLSVILLPVGYRAVVVWRKLAGVLCKAGARKKGPKSNLHQHCEWTSGKRAPLGCPRQFGFEAHRRLEVVVSRRNEEGRKRQPSKAENWRTWTQELSKTVL